MKEFVIASSGDSRQNFYVGVSLDRSQLTKPSPLHVIKCEPTDARAQLSAIIGTFHLPTLRKEDSITLFLPQNYIVRGINTDIDNWVRSGWLKHDGKAVAHPDLWQEIEQLKNEYEIVAKYLPADDPQAVLVKQIARSHHASIIKS